MAGELYRRFHLPFEILTNDKLEAARTGNWFLETNHVIARLDKLSRNEDVQSKLLAPDCGWDLIVCDEAHKMSATIFGGEINVHQAVQTRPIALGNHPALSANDRHTHNGKVIDAIISDMGPDPCAGYTLLTTFERKVTRRHSSSPA